MNSTDALFSRYIRARDGRCVMLDDACWGPLQCAHLISRRFGATRWDEDNAVTLCAGHHDWYTRHPIAWNAWRAERPGFNDLWARAMNGARPNAKDVAADLRRRLKGAA